MTIGTLNPNCFIDSATYLTASSFFRGFFSYGVMCSTIPFWAAGTALGIMFGNILPAAVVKALSVALYAMFVAVVIPPCKKDKKLILVVASSMVLSFAFAKLPYLSKLSEGNRIIILTIILGAIFALAFPHAEEKEK